MHDNFTYTCILFTIPPTGLHSRTSHPLTPSHLTSHPPQSAPEGDATITMDHSLHHHQQLQDANRGLDHILSHGRDIVTNLKGQGFTLKASSSDCEFNYSSLRAVHRLNAALQLVESKDGVVVTVHLRCI